MRRIWLLCVCLLTGCVQQMDHQAKYQAFGEAALFSDGAAMRPLVAGTVPHSRSRSAVTTALTPDELGTATPPPVTPALLESGRQHYTIFCAPCHGATGSGDGIIVQHGFPAPPSYHTDRLRRAPEGHFFDVITHGYGVMYSYGARVTPAERWAIIAYIRALQLSQHAALADVPATAALGVAR